MSDTKHCADPQNCLTNQERLRDMEQVKTAYDNSQRAHEETNTKLAATNLELVKQTTVIEGLARSIGEYKADTERDLKSISQEQKAIHSRVTTLALETTGELGKIRTEFATREGELKVGQAATKGVLKSKIDRSDILKLALLISTILGIFKYVLPGG